MDKAPRSTSIEDGVPFRGALFLIAILTVVSVMFLSAGCAGTVSGKSPVADKTPPTVSITSPAANATVSGTISVSANASDNVGVAGVQFQIDGANLGAEVTSSSYNVSWDTTTSANGSHVLTARARDAAGNTATSVGVTVNISNSTTPPGNGSADFQARCQAPGVIRCVGFDSAADIPVSKMDESAGYKTLAAPNGIVRSGGVVTVHMISPAGHIVGESVFVHACADSSFDTVANAPYTITSAPDQSTFTYNQSGSNAASGGCFVSEIPTIDTNVHADGTGSLRLTTPPYSPANAAGEWHSSFLDDNSAQFGSSTDPACQPGTLIAPCVGSEFYIQYKLMMDANQLQHFLNSNGFKTTIINNAGSASCTEIHLVTENSNQAGYPQMYHSCGGKDNSYEQFESFVPVSGDYFDQNTHLVGPNTACFHYGGRGTPADVSNCFDWVANQWMTFQWHVKIGTWYINMSHNYHRDSTVELWAAHPGQPSQLILSYNDYDLANNGALTQASGAEEYGQIWLLTYQTNKDITQNAPTGHAWYDDLIISKQRIPDADVSVPNAPDTLRAKPVSASQVNLTWRDHSAGTAGFKIERCVGTSTTCWAGYATWSPLATVAAGTTSYTDTGLTTGTSYSYRVYANNSSGNSASSGGSCWAEPSGNGTSCYGTAKTF
jgi:hypothetical protein